MGYTAPTTRATSDLITASIWNTDLVNNISYLANPPACRVYRSSAVSVGNATETAIGFDSERFDTDTMHDTVTNNSRVTFNTAGLYIVTGHVTFTGNATGLREVYIKLNNTTYIGIASLGAGGGDANNRPMPVSTVYKFAAADYIELRCYQTSGGALNTITTAAYGQELAVVWIGLG